jgi:3-hydroxyisobutyrate dehydrogenase-like beta-hydroxyacid dehydrogenase
VTLVGFAGLGRMGVPMARRIAAAGHDLTVWNRTRAKADAFTADVPGVSVADTPAALAANVDIIVSMLADDKALHDFHLAPGGVVDALVPGTLVIDMSTVSPEVSETVRTRVIDAGGRFVQAPVSGSTAAAESGELLILAAGEPADVEAAEPVLRTMARDVVRVGGPGAGLVMKLAVNTVVYGLSQAVAEGLVLAERAGVDRLTAYRVFADSAVAAPMVHYRRELFEHPGRVEPAFALDLALKDLRLIEQLAARAGAPVPQATVNRDQLERASAAGYGSWDMSAVAEHLRGRTTTSGPTDGSPEEHATENQKDEELT